MTYEITKSNGDVLIELKDGIIDQNSSSLIFVGKNVVNYGQIQNNNFLHLLENFAATTEPPNKLDGQLWLDTTNHVLKLYHQGNWQTVSTLSYSDASNRANNQGNLWYDSANKQLFINNGSNFDLIGPDNATGFNTTRWVSDVLADTSDVVHAVIKCKLDNEVIAIIAKDNFTINTSSSIVGFSIIGRGINFKNGTSTDVQLYGMSQLSINSNSLKNQDGNAYISASSSNTANTIMQRDANKNTAISKLTVKELASDDGVISGEWKIGGNFIPTTDNVVNLGTAELSWANVHTQNLHVNTVNGSIVNATAINATTAQFSTLTDSSNNSVTKIDTDVTLASDSDSNLGTQRAIKAYIDAAIAAEVIARNNAINGVNGTISDLQYVPAGTIFFTAGSGLPSGFLEANGQLVSKSTYNALYQALGGAGSIYNLPGTEFKLPDLRGEFVRAWDQGRGIDVARALGSSQAAQYNTHQHFTFKQVPGNTYKAGESVVSSTNYPVDNVTRSDNDESYIISGEGSIPARPGVANVGLTSPSGGNETRPRNIALHAIIKY